MAVEGFHRGLAGFGNVGAAKNLKDGDPYVFEVGEGGDVIDIPDVETELLGPGDGIAAVALGPTADARAYLVAAGLLLGVQG